MRFHIIKALTNVLKNNRSVLRVKLSYISYIQDCF